MHRRLLSSVSVNRRVLTSPSFSASLNDRVNPGKAVQKARSQSTMVVAKRKNEKKRKRGRGLGFWRPEREKEVGYSSWQTAAGISRGYTWLAFP